MYSKSWAYGGFNIQNLAVKPLTWLLQVTPASSCVLNLHLFVFFYKARVP